MTALQEAWLEYAASTNMDAAPAVEIVWTQAQGGERCIGRDELATKVQAAVGQSPQTVSPGGLLDKAIVRGSIGNDEGGEGWAAMIEVRRGDGPPLRRELHLRAADCRQLDETVVLVVEMLLDAAILQRRQPVAENAQPSVTVAIGPDVAVGTGILPGLGVGFGLIGEAEFDPIWPIALWGHFWSPTLPATDGTGAGAKLEAWTFGAAVCRLTFPPTSWALFGCVGGSAGLITSTGIAVDVSQVKAEPYVEIDARVGARLRIVGPLVARLALGAGVPLTRYTYFYLKGDSHDVFQTAAIATTAELGIEFRAPR